MNEYTHQLGDAFTSPSTPIHGAAVGSRSEEFVARSPRPQGRHRLHRSSRLRAASLLPFRAIAVTVTAAALAASVVVTGMTGSANAAVASEPTFSAMASSAVRLTNLTGFAHIGQDQLTKSVPVTAIPLTPGLVIHLGSSRGATLADRSAGVAITGTAADGSVTVVKANETGLGFGIVTNRHTQLEYRYKAILAPGTMIKPAADGGLDQFNGAGAVIAHISPAYAIDSTGAHLAASYSFDSRNQELIVKADTTRAKGPVFIDPSWRCWATAGAYGAAWILAAAAWIFTDGTAAWVAWALRVWFGLQLNAANNIAKACALH